MATDNHKENHLKNMQGEGFKDHSLKATTTTSSHRSVQDSTISHKAPAPNRLTNQLQSSANTKSWLFRLEATGEGEDIEKRKARLQREIASVSGAGLGDPGAKVNAHHGQKGSGDVGNRKDSAVDLRGVGDWAEDWKS